MQINNYKKYEPFFNSWYITKMIGEGSFGKVYEVEREDFGRKYKSALKIITIPQNKNEIKSAMADGMDEKSTRAYFRGLVEELISEFDIMARIKGNTNIVSYEDHAVYEHEDDIGWDIIIRMELLTPLIDYTQKRSFQTNDILQLGIDICSALEICEKNNIIHRDIKPENIFVSMNGDYKLGDFGIARTAEKTSSGMSKKGTYTYMAPEVYMEKPYNANVDLYSLGIVLYRFFNNNRTPFLPEYPTPITYHDRETALEKRMKGFEIPGIKNIDRNIADVISKACSYDPKKRYQTAAEMKKALLCLKDSSFNDFTIVEEQKFEDKTEYTDMSDDLTVALSNEDNNKELGGKTDSLEHSEWYGIVKELNDVEIVERYLNEDEWQDEYRQECEREIARRGIDINDFIEKSQLKDEQLDRTVAEQEEQFGNDTEIFDDYVEETAYAEDMEEDETSTGPGVIGVIAIILICMMILPFVFFGLNMISNNANLQSDRILSDDIIADLQILDINNNLIISNEDVDSVEIQYDSSTGYYLLVDLNEEGRDKMSKGTLDNIGNPLHIKVNDEIISSPMVNQQIDDDIFIISFDSEEEARTIMESLLSKQNENKHYVIGMSGDFPPFEYHNEAGELVGFDVELIENLSNDLGFSYDIVDLPFDELVASIDNGKINMIISGISANEDRELYCDFTIPYYNYEFDEDGEMISNPLSIAVANGDEFLERINNQIEIYTNDGTISALEDKYITK